MRIFPPPRLPACPPAQSFLSRRSVRRPPRRCATWRNPSPGCRAEPQYADRTPTGGLWLPAGGEGDVQGRLMLLRNLRRRIVERDYDYKRFCVDAEPKEAQVVTE